MNNNLFSSSVNYVSEHLKQLGWVARNERGAMEVLRPPMSAPMDALPVLLIRKGASEAMCVVTDLHGKTHRINLVIGENVSQFFSPSSPFLTQDKLDVLSA